MKNTCIELAPIVLFCYNRLDHLQLTINGLKKNTEAIESDLYVFSDGPKNEGDSKKVRKVRDYLESISGFKSITIEKSDKNKGLANSLIFGISKVINIHQKVIVVEDDLIVSEYFLRFLNDGLNRYKEKKNVYTINGYSSANILPDSYPLDSYFVYRASSWGWATWKDRWEKVIWDIDYYKKELEQPINELLFARGGHDLPKVLRHQINGRVDSWAVRWCYTVHKNNGICLNPRYSYVSPKHDRYGTHVKARRKNLENDTKLAKPVVSYPQKEDVENQVAKNFCQFFGPLAESVLSFEELLLLNHEIKNEARWLFKWKEFRKLRSEQKIQKVKSYLKALIMRFRN